LRSRSQFLAIAISASIASAREAIEIFMMDEGLVGVRLEVDSVQSRADEGYKKRRKVEEGDFRQW
jgi:hypothetical protein